MLGGWSQPKSSFHAGEQQVQEHDKIETFARRVARDRMPNVHWEF